MSAQIGSHLCDFRLIATENIFLVDLTNFTAKRNDLYANYYGSYANITSLLRGQFTLYYAS